MQNPPKSQFFVQTPALLQSCLRSTGHAKCNCTQEMNQHEALRTLTHKGNPAFFQISLNPLKTRCHLWIAKSIQSSVKLQVNSDAILLPWHRAIKKESDWLILVCSSSVGKLNKPLPMPFSQSIACLEHSLWHFQNYLRHFSKFALDYISCWYDSNPVMQTGVATGTWLLSKVAHLNFLCQLFLRMLLWLCQMIHCQWKSSCKDLCSCQMALNFLQNYHVMNPNKLNQSSNICQEILTDIALLTRYNSVNPGASSKPFSIAQAFFTDIQSLSAR